MLLDNYEYGLKIEELVEDDVSALLPGRSGVGRFTVVLQLSQASE